MRPGMASRTEKSQSKKKSPVTQRAVLVMLVGVVVGLASTHFVKHSSTSTSADADVVQSALKAALTVDQAMHLPAAVHPTQEQLDEQRSTSTEDIARLFTGQAQKQELAELDQIISNETTDGQLVLGAGITDFTVNSLSMGTTSATIKATLGTWTKTSYTTPLGQTVVDSPTAQLSVTATLAKQPTGTWKVATLTQTLTASSADSDAPSPSPQSGN